MSGFWLAEVCLPVSPVPFEQQRNRVSCARGDRDGLHDAAAETLGVGEREAVECARTMRPGRLIGVAGIVGGRRNVGDALCLDSLDGLRDDTVLEHRLVEVTHVVADHFAAGGRECENAVGEILLADVGGVERETRARRDLVHDLHHRAALVAAARREVLQNLDVGGGGQRAAGLVRCRAALVVEAVGDHADLDAGAVDAQAALVQRLLELRGGRAAGKGGRVGGLVARPGVGQHREAGERFDGGARRIQRCQRCEQSVAPAPTGVAAGGVATGGDATGNGPAESPPARKASGPARKSPPEASKPS